MEILPYSPELAGGLATAYNRAVAGVPHCFPVNADGVLAALATNRGQARSDGALRARTVSIALGADRSVQGFIDVGVGTPKPERTEQGVIPFFWYSPGYRSAGQALLTAAEQHLRDRGAVSVQAFPQEYRYPFYHLESAYLSIRIGHVEALLARNGYARTRGEVYLDWPDFTVPKPVAPGVDVEIAPQWSDRQGRLPGVKLLAVRNGEELGVCECESCGEFTRAPEAQDWFYTAWLGVAERVQGRGLGRYLLQRALTEMHGAGYRHAAISTALNNHRAYLFYSNFGYRTVDWTYGWSRRLD